MMNLKNLFRRLVLGVMLASMSMLGGCSNTSTWQEEVRLVDGRVIMVTQKRRYEGAYSGQDFGDLPREFWLKFKLPEFGGQEITWHENLGPQVLNVHQGKLYIVAIPFTEREFVQYGKPVPFYIGYRYEAGQWQRIPFAEIPEAIYDTNLLINNGSPSGAKFVTFTMKDAEMKDETIGQVSKRIDPNTKIH
ncbi:MAG: hypothetical protein HY306_13635 [Nitrosomonadales bacterium]|nr:hypothetical protein [Nitrosomonadales bacterium]